MPTVENQNEQINLSLDNLKMLCRTRTATSNQKFATCIFNLIEAYKANNVDLQYKGFLFLLEKNEITNIKIPYQQFRQFYNLGYLSTFCEHKLLCNSLRHASKLKVLLSALPLTQLNMVERKVKSESIITLELLESWIKQAPNQNSIKDLITAINQVVPCAGEMIVESKDMPRSFYALITPTIANNIWEANFGIYKAEPNKDTLQFKQGLKSRLMHILAIYYSILDLSFIMFNRECVATLSDIDMYKNFDFNSAEATIKNLTTYFLSHFKQDMTREIITQTANDNKSLLTYTMSLNVIRNNSILNPAFKAFY